MSAPLWSPGTLKQPGDIVRPTSAGAVMAGGPNNPNFDEGETGWVYTGDGNAAITTAAPVFNGTYSLKSNDTGGNYQKLATNTARLPIVPGQIVTIRCYVYCWGDADRTRVQPRINWYNDADVLISPSVLATDPAIIGNGYVRVTPGLTNSGGLVGLAAPGVWVLLEVTGTAPPAAATWTPAIAFNWGPDGAWAVDYITWEYASQEAPNNNLYRAVQAAAGFTANIEPDWPTTIGLTIVDNEVTWECVSGNSITWQAHRILVSGLVEPDWPLVVNSAVPDNTIGWSLNPRRVVDSHVPQSRIGMLAAKKIFSPDVDIINFSATVNPLDWSTIDDAGFLPFGLQVYGANEVAAMGLYRGNLAAFNSQGCQIWQVDPDPAQMALLDAVPLPCTYPKSLSPVGDDLVFLTDLGIRSLSLSGPQINLQSGYFGKAIDPLVTRAIKAAIASGYEPLALYWPAQGQYWLFFGTQAFVLTINGPKQEQKSWSRYTFPWSVNHWTILGTDLYLRSGDLVVKVDPDALVDDLQFVTSTYQIGVGELQEFDAPTGWGAGNSSIDLPDTFTAEIGTGLTLLGPSVTGLFADTTITAGGAAGSTSVTLSSSATTTTPAALVVRYPAEGPFTVEGGNEVDSRLITLSEPIVEYPLRGAVVRIVNATGVQWNYIARDLGNCPDMIVLEDPLEAEVVTLTIFPPGCSILNTVNAAIMYAPYALASGPSSSTVALSRALVVDSTGLEAIVCKIQRTAVAGGSGTDAVDLEDVAAFANGGQSIVEITANGTFDVPAGITAIDTLVVGGGGPAGATAFWGPGGGGGGQVIETLGVVVTPLETLTIEVGAGGTFNNADGGASKIKRGATELIVAQPGGAGLGLAGHGATSGNGNVGGAGHGGTGSAGGGGGAGAVGGASVGTGGAGGAGLDESARWSSAYGEAGWFGGGGGGGLFGGGAGHGANGMGTGANTGGGGGGDGATQPNADAGVVLIAYGAAVEPPEAGYPGAPVLIGDFAALGEGTEFESVMQWPFLDLNTFNAEKELVGFDLSIDGIASVSFGWDQRQTERNSRNWTTPYEICGDTVPGTELPFSISAPSFGMRLTFQSGQPWKWYSSNMYIKDDKG